MPRPRPLLRGGGTFVRDRGQKIGLLGGLRQGVVQLSYKGLVDDDVLALEQERISREREEAQLARDVGPGG